MTQPGAVGIERKQRMLLSEETVERASSRLQTIICSSRLTEAERFYGRFLRCRSRAGLMGTWVTTALRDHGAQWNRIPGLPHDDDGVVVTPSGAKVVWFRDPDGNLLSIVQYA